MTNSLKKTKNLTLLFIFLITLNSCFTERELPPFQRFCQTSESSREGNFEYFNGDLYRIYNDEFDYIIQCSLLPEENRKIVNACKRSRDADGIPTDTIFKYVLIFDLQEELNLIQYRKESLQLHRDFTKAEQYTYTLNNDRQVSGIQKEVFKVNKHDGFEELMESHNYTVEPSVVDGTPRLSIIENGEVHTSIRFYTHQLNPYTDILLNVNELEHGYSLFPDNNFVEFFPDGYFNKCPSATINFSQNIIEEYRVARDTEVDGLASIFKYPTLIETFSGQELSFSYNCRD